MPAYLRGQPRDQTTAVKVGDPNRNVYYVFKAKDIAALENVSNADLQALGHQELSTIGESALIIIGANAPKPGRARKVIRRNPGVSQQGSVSTFYAAGRELQVRAAGWDLTSSPKSVNLRQNNRTVTAIAQLENGLLYAFPLNRSDFNTYGSILGLQTPQSINTDAERALLITGTTRPRPAIAARELDNGSTFSTFVSHDNIGSMTSQGFYQVEGAVLA